ncbi:VanZ family protein [Anaerorhabdus furcosa]|uniref:VanZ like family protein n=1 Tax=Anaerorhabdus furcosa TaxID=118967 RepID=A0A1T4L5B8_9FIRM|nr:VanZ family protein [Anaerorhabdus furcosa]SJZ49710.1 VanZ like family protein [Anaerorhabdus furcosa]
MNKYKRLITLPLFLIFIATNFYWFKRHDDLSMYKQMLIVCASVAIFMAAALIEVFYAKNNRIRIRLFKIFVTLLLLYYLGFLCAVLFLDGFFFTRSATHYVNLVPFKTIKEFFATMRDENNLRAFGNLVGNAILFAPMGLLLPLWSKKFHNIFLFTFTIFVMVSGVEIFQHYSNMGTADVDDIILNVAGALMVFFVFKFIFFMVKDKIEMYFKDDDSNYQIKL